MAEIFRPPVFANLEELQDEQLDQIQNLLFNTLVVVASSDPFTYVETFQESWEIFDSSNDNEFNNLLLSTLQVESFAPSYPEYPDNEFSWNDEVANDVQNLLLSVLSTTDIIGTASITNQNDTVVAAGTITIVGTLSVTSGNDTVVSSGTTTILGTLSSTNIDDTVVASGSVGSAVSGSANITEQSDTSSASGTTTIVGSSSITNQDDTSATAGTTTIIGILSKTNNNDAATAFGIVGTPPDISSYLPMTGVGR